jgi:hypothetical protein
MFLQVKSQEAAERVFATAYADLDPEVTSMDPAERLEFSRPPRAGIQRFDTRNDDELREVIFDHIHSMEYADRHRAEALSLLREVAKKDPDPTIRWSSLWAIQKFTGLHGKDTIAESLNDEHPEVSDWAKLLLREISGILEGEPDTRKGKFDESNPFDQTLPLMIAGYARVLVPEIGWIQATLSPQWFETIMGRVMACTQQKTFETDLVIEKSLFEYHPDGTNHYEIYKFCGFTQKITENVYSHHYESLGHHTFYPSGKVEDISLKPIPDVFCPLLRKATTNPDAMAEVPSGKVVRSVRGRYMGNAYVNLNRLMSNRMKIGPGEVQLSTLHHPIVGPMTNTLLFGTFKGKLSDKDGDGYLDVNTEWCHATVDGKLDYNLSGSPFPDPFDPYQTV